MIAKRVGALNGVFSVLTVSVSHDADLLAVEGIAAPPPRPIFISLCYR